MDQIMEIVVTSYLEVLGKLVTVDECRKAFASYPSSTGSSLDYWNGAIEMTIDGQAFFDLANSYDYILPLWASIAEMLVKLAEGKDALFFMPDQPVDVCATALGSTKIKLEIRPAGGPSNRSAVADRGAFVEQVAAAGVYFFEGLKHLGIADLQGYENCATQLESLMKKRSGLKFQ
jgi:hypothetical protein